MCIPRNVEECTYGSTFTYGNRDYVVIKDCDEDDNTVIGRDKLTNLSRPFCFGTTVISHFLSPVEKMRYGRSECEIMADLLSV